MKKEFNNVIQKYKAGSPINENLIWIDVSVSELTNEIINNGQYCSNYLCKQMLKEDNLKQRKMKKCVTLKEVENRNEQFENINSLKEEYKKNGNPILSIDVKKKELLGNFYREGSCYCNDNAQVYDHDFNTFSNGILVPHGIYDIEKNIGYITLSSSKDTAEFACDCILNYWNNYGKFEYPNATSILILCDGGGSNSARGFLFKENLCRISKEIGIEIRVAHYPPYTSKHNPIEHKLFSHVSRTIKGCILDTIEKAKEVIEKTKTTKGLKVMVNIANKKYKTGTKATASFIENCPIKFDDKLPKWNYTALAIF